jgi:hypothetical protein|tara:strand:- start:453 stop:590 length:138 start_codon:yes stop_codon:yes gene_type:complete
MIKIIIGVVIGYFLATTAVGQELLPQAQAFTVQFLEFITNTVKGI